MATPSATAEVTVEEPDPKKIPESKRGTQKQESKSAEGSKDESKEGNKNFSVDKVKDAIKIQKQLTTFLANEKLSEEDMAKEEYRTQFSNECIRLACELWHYNVNPFTILTKFSKDYSKKEGEREKEKAREEAEAAIAAAKKAEAAAKEATANDKDPWGLQKKGAVDSDADGDEQEAPFDEEQEAAAESHEAKEIASQKTKISATTASSDADDDADPWGDVPQDVPAQSVKPEAKETPKKKISLVIDETIEQLEKVLKEQRQARSKKIKDDLVALKIQFEMQRDVGSQPIEGLIEGLERTRKFLKYHYHFMHDANIAFKIDEKNKLLFNVNETPLDLELAELHTQCLPVVVELFKVVYFMPHPGFKKFIEHVLFFFSRVDDAVRELASSNGVFNMPPVKSLDSTEESNLTDTFSQTTVRDVISQTDSETAPPFTIRPFHLDTQAVRYKDAADAIVASLKSIEAQLSDPPHLTLELREKLIAAIPRMYGADIFERIINRLATKPSFSESDFNDFIEIFYALAKKCEQDSIPLCLMGKGVNQFLEPIYEMFLLHLMLPKQKQYPRVQVAFDGLYRIMNSLDMFHEKAIPSDRQFQHDMVLGRISDHLLQDESEYYLTKPARGGEGTIPEPTPIELFGIVASNSGPHHNVLVPATKFFEKLDGTLVEITTQPHEDHAQRRIDKKVKGIKELRYEVSVPFDYSNQADKVRSSAERIQVLLLADALRQSPGKEPLALVASHLCQTPISEDKDAKVTLTVEAKERWVRIACLLKEEFLEHTAIAYDHLRKIRSEHDKIGFFASGKKLIVRVVGLDNVLNYLGLIAANDLLHNGYLSLSPDVGKLIVQFLHVQGLPPLTTACTIQHRY